MSEGETITDPEGREIPIEDLKIGDIEDCLRAALWRSVSAIVEGGYVRVDPDSIAAALNRPPNRHLPPDGEIEWTAPLLRDALFAVINKPADRRH